MDFLFAKAFWAALLMGLCCPVVGRNLVLGRSILLGLALPQVSLCGVAFVFLGAACHWGWCAAFGDDSARAFFGAALFTLPALLWLAHRQRLSEATLAFVFLAAVSSANLFLSSDAVGEIYIQDLFHGRLLLISAGSLAVLAITLGACTLLSLACRRRILLILSAPDFARTSGLRSGAWNLLVALLDGIVISVAVATVGPLVTFGFLILPVLCAAVFARSLHMHLGMAMVFGAVMAAAGSAASYRYDLPLGDSVVGCGCVALVLCWLVLRVPFPNLQFKTHP
jgi:ABC-type Mn2+/Zn2+ transport system permease subunit